jgi:hypothetical protein
MRPYVKNIQHQKGLAEKNGSSGTAHKTLSSNPTPKKHQITSMSSLIRDNKILTLTLAFSQMQPVFIF